MAISHSTRLNMSTSLIPTQLLILCNVLTIQSNIPTIDIQYTRSYQLLYYEYKGIQQETQPTSNDDPRDL